MEAARAPRRAERRSRWYIAGVLPGPTILAALIALGAHADATGPGAGLLAAAASSGRPRECAPSSHRGIARGPSIWAIARRPSLQAFCDRMARAHAQLPTSPEAAKQAAEEADRLLPGTASAAALLGRVHLALGALDDAAKAFARARAIDPRSVDDPLTMHDLASVQRKKGELAAALETYRALVPRVELIAPAERRVAVLLEAAHVAMARTSPSAPSGDADAKAKGDGDPALAEAVAFLREARQRPPSALAADVLLSLALVLDRAGDRVPADAALADARPLVAARAVRGAAPDYVAAPEEQHAIAALAHEASGDRAAAIAAWGKFLAAHGDGRWAQAARARRDALEKGSPPARAGAKTRIASTKPVTKGASGPAKKPRGGP